MDNIENEIVQHLKNAASKMKEALDDIYGSIQNVRRIHNPVLVVCDVLTDIYQCIPDILFEITQAVSLIPRWKKEEKGI